MKILNIVKSIILEAREFIAQYNIGGQKVSISYNTHSNLAIGTSHYGRVEIDDIKYSMEEIMDVIINISLKILSSKGPSSRDSSILVVDNQIGIDYHFWINLSGKGVLHTTINTSIRHPRHLPSNKNSAKIIITRVGDTIVKESIGEEFTSVQIGNIIVYYKIN